MNWNPLPTALYLAQRLLRSPLRYGILPRAPLREYEAACLYLALLDERLTRHQSTHPDDLPDRNTAIAQRYPLFLERCRDCSPQELQAEIRRYEQRLQDAGLSR